MREAEPDEVPEGGIRSADVTPEMRAVADQNDAAVNESLDNAVMDYMGHFELHKRDGTKCESACGSVTFVAWLHSLDLPSVAMLAHTAIRRLAGGR